MANENKTDGASLLAYTAIEPVMVMEPPASQHFFAASTANADLSAERSLEQLEDAVCELAESPSPIAMSNEVAPANFSTDLTTDFPSDLVLAASHPSFPKQLVDFLSASIGCEVHLFAINQRKSATRVATSAGTQSKLVSITKIEEKLAIEAASVGSCLASEIFDAEVFPSAIADELRTEADLDEVIAYPIKAEGTATTFVVLIQASKSLSQRTRGLGKQQIAVVEGTIGRLLSTWEACQYALSWRNRLSFVGRLKNPKLLASICGCLIAMFFVPIPYLPKRKCTLEPSFRHHVASPVDGVLMEAFVRPGDMVTQGQLLAKLDDKQLLRDLSIATADFETASKRREVALATRVGGDLRIAQLEQQQADVTIKSIQAKLAKTEIRSPVAGLLVQGDWISNLGAPVELGDALFEVCEPDKYLAKVELESNDLNVIKPGCSVVLCNGSFIHRVEGVIQRIEPKAQVIDDRCVFYAEVELKNPDETLRPGLKINAKLKPEWRSLGWQIFHRPYQWFANLWVW